ncbi:MAG: WD40/YVTN/BNR-like repeat-containing protein, partial [Bacteroidota bacterium]
MQKDLSEMRFFVAALFLVAVGESLQAQEAGTWQTLSGAPVFNSRMRLLAFALLSFLAVGNLYAQTSGGWKKLPYTPAPVSRINDGYYLTPSLGWVVNGIGQIHKTTDGGQTWLRVLEQSGTHFRSVGFIDSLNGWAGNIGISNSIFSSDTNILYQTNDGGMTWMAVTA